MIIRRAWFRILLLALFTFMLGFSYNYHLPKIEAFLLTEAERLSESHAPVRIWAKQLHFHLFPLGIVLEDVRLLPKAPVDRYLAPAKLKEIGARLAILPLLRGEIRLAQVFIRDSELSLFLREDLFKSQGGKKLAFDFNLLYSLPIDELSLENVRIQGRIAANNIVFRVDDLILAIENRYRSLFVELRTPEVMIKPSGQVVPLKAQLELRTLVEAEEAQVSAFKLRLNDSFVVASGRFNGDFSAGQVSNGALDARAKLQLVDLNTWEKVFFNPGKLPVFNGTAELDLGVEIRDGKGYRFEADLNTGALAIGKFKIGTVQTSLSTDLKSVKSDSIVVDNSSGSIRIEKVNVQLSPLAFTASAITEKVDLRRFL